MMDRLPYDPLRDFAPVALVASLPFLLVVHPSLPVKSVKELITLAQAKPGALNCSTSGNGSGSHLALALFSRSAGVQIMRIPYNGDGPAIVDLLGGQVPMKFDNVSTALQHVRGGKLRPLGITAPARSALRWAKSTILNATSLANTGACGAHCWATASASGRPCCWRPGAPG